MWFRAGDLCNSVNSGFIGHVNSSSLIQIQLVFMPYFTVVFKIQANLYLQANTCSIVFERWI